MIRQAYCSLEALEEIHAFRDEAAYEALHQVLETHHRISVHLSDDDWDEQLGRNACLRYFAKRATSRKGYELENTAVHCHEVMKSTTSADLAGTVFIVDDEPAACARWREQYGVCVVSRQAPAEANYLTQELSRKEIRPARSYRTSVNGNEKLGWYAALSPRTPAWQAVPLNSLVIVDNYLLGENINRLEAGQENLVSLLDSLLPPTLDVHFHLLLVTNNSTRFLTSQNLTQLAENLRRKLARPYRLRIGVVTREDGREHRRAIIGNYYFGASHHGFACFRGSEAQWPNDLVVSGLFSGIAATGFDVPWVSMHDELRAVRIQRDRNRKPVNDNPNYLAINLAFGFCDNRLLDLV